jgi:hypothetical protein
MFAIRPVRPESCKCPICCRRSAGWTYGAPAQKERSSRLSPGKRTLASFSLLTRISLRVPSVKFALVLGLSGPFTFSQLKLLLSIGRLLLNTTISEGLDL